MESSNANNVKIGHLDTKPAIREELARVYRAMRRGEVDCSDGARLCYVLVTLSKLLEKESFLDLSSLLEIAQDNGRGRHGDR